MTDEQTPTPTPAASGTGSSDRGSGRQTPTGATNTHAMSMAAPSRSMPDAAQTAGPYGGPARCRREQPALAKAKTKPSGSPASRMPVST